MRLQIVIQVRYRLPKLGLEEDYKLWPANNLLVSHRICRHSVTPGFECGKLSLRQITS